MALQEALLNLKAKAKAAKTGRRVPPAEVSRRFNKKRTKGTAKSGKTMPKDVPISFA